MTTTSDKELLELAAKAADEGIVFYGECLRAQTGREWNPLTDDGDALRLAVRLDINVYVQLVDGHTMASAKPEIDEVEPHGTDPYAATRRAIVRAAASIGEQL